ncbi:MAG: outer membrane protein assembly factor BamD [Gammaproteobacteria bacterium]|nr:outer membrane protein assembly factor BamD [Gammaproteobacteria bacterium]
MRRLIRFWLILGLASLAACGREHRVIHHWPAQRFYHEGVVALKNGNYPMAIRRLQELEADYPYGRYAAQAEIIIAYAYYKNGESDAAIAAAKRFIRLHPTDARVPYAYYLTGLVEFHKNRSAIEHFFGVNQLRGRDTTAARAALRAFGTVVRRYPHSRYAPDAAERMNYLVDMLARNNIAIARYYYTQGAYLATIGRCRLVIEHYQRTPAVQDALGLMAMAYERLGLTDLSRDTARVLAKNFPHSAYLRKLERDHILVP